MNLLITLALSPAMEVIATIFGVIYLIYVICMIIGGSNSYKFNGHELAIRQIN